MFVPTPYGEADIIRAHFARLRGREPHGGYLVDVGAGDGESGSNSLDLLAHYGWGGLLIDPLPANVAALRRLYAARPDVRVVPKAVGAVAGETRLYPANGDGGVSTLLDAWAHACETRWRHVKYGEPIRVPVAPLHAILDENGAPLHIDFLSIDTEGTDIEVLESFDWHRRTVGLVCIETLGLVGDPAHDLAERALLADVTQRMAAHGYRLLTDTRANAFFVPARGEGT